MKAAHHHQAKDLLILVGAGTLVANIVRRAAGAELGNAAKKLAVFQVGLHLAAGLSVAVGLPVANGILEFLAELLRLGYVGQSNRNQS